MKGNWIVLVVLSLAFIPRMTYSQIAVQDSVTITSINRLSISLTAILANPEKYNGMRVYISGYLHVRFEDSGIYLSKTDADYLIAENALWVSYADTPKLYPISSSNRIGNAVNVQYFDGRMVRLGGKLNTSSRGHMGAFCAELENVDNIMELQQYGKQELWNIDSSGVRSMKPENK